MDIERAKKLKPGDFVHCPADRGKSGFGGKVTHVETTVKKDLTGKEYIWIGVQGPSHISVWPSNRLG